MFQLSYCIISSLSHHTRQQVVQLHTNIFSQTRKIMKEFTFDLFGYKIRLCWICSLNQFHPPAPLIPERPHSFCQQLECGMWHGCLQTRPGKLPPCHSVCRQSGVLAIRLPTNYAFFHLLKLVEILWFSSQKSGAKKIIWVTTQL